MTKGKRPLERFGHTAALYKGSLIVFGGEHKYNQEIRMRETFNDIWAYNLNNNEFKAINAGNKLACEPRKGHTMAMVGFHMFVHGGVNSRGLLMEEPVVFNFCKLESLMYRKF